MILLLTSILGLIFFFIKSAILETNSSRFVIIVEAILSIIPVLGLITEITFACVQADEVEKYNTASFWHPVLKDNKLTRWLFNKYDWNE